MFENESTVCETEREETQKMRVRAFLRIFSNFRSDSVPRRLPYGLSLQDGGPEAPTGSLERNFFEPRSKPNLHRDPPDRVTLSLGLECAQGEASFFLLISVLKKRRKQEKMGSANEYNREYG